MTSTSGRRGMMCGGFASRRSVLAAGLVAAAGWSRPALGAKVLRLGHGLPTTHPVHLAMQFFVDLVRDGTGGNLTIQIFADGLIGQELDLLDQVKLGTIDLTKASASVLANVNPRYGVFDLPFLFRDKVHWQAVVAGKVGDDILAATSRTGMIGLTFYDAGARSFYGRKPIERPEDLRDLRIRVQPSPMMVRMVELFGAEARPLPWSVVYSALQTGLVDGAENNLTALTYGRHAEVVHHYSFTEHTMVPDVLLMGAESWARLSPGEQSVVRAAARASFARQVELWSAAEVESRDTAARMGVAFAYPDKAPFKERVASLRHQWAEDPDLASLLSAVEASN